MIKLYLGLEPNILTTTRANKLNEAVRLLNSHGLNSDEFKKVFKTGYQCARPLLFKRQHNKCAFCEISNDDCGSPVEHFRPKLGAEEKIGGVWRRVSTHYWWLAWTWENLLFACERCNNSGSKGNKFPIRSSASRVLAPPSPCSYPISAIHYDCASEERLLIDPRLDNPIDHIQWIPVNRTLHPKNWQWTVAGLDDKGDMTIEVLDLSLRADKVTNHLKLIVSQWVDADIHLKEGRPIAAQATWDRIIDSYINNPEQPFRNAAWWACNALFPEAERNRLGLSHPPMPFG
ncbi:HNH endonuclease [Pseudomonas sp. WS 5146]|uniref:HNH endonuclease n=1 Tax=Pseudomonas sp. WS 5146 TaxID=2717494 RepID=UPI0014730E5A|nr:hypothetical protein [Pseudomonas sp. WS 5146]NMX59071.1 hypothetical protein [Pseudomonas sp. WS 5146]